MESTTVISSNFSAGEILNIADHVARTNLELAMVKALETTIKERKLLQEGIEALKRRQEIVSAQVFFAQILIQALEDSLKHVTSLREFKKVFSTELEKTLFER